MDDDLITLPPTPDGIDERLLAQYESNRLIYDKISDRLASINDTILHGDDAVASTLLYLADTYALITSMTPTSVADLAFSRLLECDGSHDAVDRILSNTRARGDQQWAVLFPHNKADYITKNRRTVDYDEQVTLLRNGNLDLAHRQKIDNVTGISAAKAAFSLAMCGFTRKLCIDSNVRAMFNLDEDDIPNTVVVERYDAFCDALRDRAPVLQIQHDVSNFLWQWVCFDANRSGVETHDGWFMGTGESAVRSTGLA